jgi:peptidoglycan L-alanyl-D-glutamate endopeptidase CwlK
VTDKARRERNAKRIAELHPDLQRKANAIMTEMDALGHPMVITDGYRSPAEQLKLYAQGRTAPGKIVTTLRFGKHNERKAFDAAFFVNGSITWDGPWAEYGKRCANHGCTWGGNWKRFKDRPHCELP